MARSMVSIMLHFWRMVKPKHQFTNWKFCSALLIGFRKLGEQSSVAGRFSSIYLSLDHKNEIGSQLGANLVHSTLFHYDVTTLVDMLFCRSRPFGIRGFMRWKKCQQADPGVGLASKVRTQHLTNEGPALKS